MKRREGKARQGKEREVDSQSREFARQRQSQTAYGNDGTQSPFVDLILFI